MRFDYITEANEAVRGYNDVTNDFLKRTQDIKANLLATRDFINDELERLEALEKFLSALKLENETTKVPLNGPLTRLQELDGRWDITGNKSSLDDELTRLEKEINVSGS